MSDITQEHQPLAAFIQDFRHHMHRHPELSNEEVNTTASIRAVLEKYQIRVIDLPLKTGLVAEIGGINPGELVVLRSDIDALPIEEKSGVDYTSQNPGVMHACGHDFHTSAALGAADFAENTGRFSFRHGAHSVSGGGRNRSRCPGAD
ncbi:Uncharacterized hydrolase YxeP [Serratia rubidaea]|uniref:Uncharacterized hydrolase YxeP n=1 Tax=Serratia rubidaea TaxID=61652 RepID=A0A4U9HKN1_SERRU|nr:Uncharacterized hydrolase YxeP [Serratia rubidaea]